MDMQRLLFILLQVICTATVRMKGPAEYCQSDVFHAECRRNEVVMMTSAQYGRMHIGKCVVAELGYLGCSSDVLPLLHSACSGRSECDYPVPSTELDQTKPCFQELKTFLEVDYKCVKVAMAEKSVCEGSPYLKLLTGEGYLSSNVALSYACGTLSSPWRIPVSPGQTLHIALIVFSDTAQEGTTGVDTPDRRPQKALGYITDRVNGKNMTIRRHPNSTHQHQRILSSEHSVEIQFSTDGDSASAPVFLLQYEVTGCQDLVAPRFAWYKRDGDRAVVGCEHSETTWHLTCMGSTWAGVIGNCMPAVAAIEGEPNGRSLPPGSTIAIIIFIALAIALGVLGCGFWTVFRHHFKKQKRSGPGASTDPTATLSLSGTTGHQTVLGYPGESKYFPPPQPQHQGGGHYHGIDSTQASGDGILGTPQGWNYPDGEVTPGDSDYGSQSYSSMRHVMPPNHNTHSNAHKNARNTAHSNAHNNAHNNTSSVLSNKPNALNRKPSGPCNDPYNPGNGNSTNSNLHSNTHNDGVSNHGNFTHSSSVASAQNAGGHMQQQVAANEQNRISSDKTSSLPITANIPAPHLSSCLSSSSNVPSYITAYQGSGGPHIPGQRARKPSAAGYRSNSMESGGGGGGERCVLIGSLQ